MGSNPTDRTNEIMTQDFYLGSFLFFQAADDDMYFRIKIITLIIIAVSRKLLLQGEVLQQNKLGGAVMLVTTTPVVAGREIAEYRGIVFGEVVSGVNFIKDMFSGITDILGGRSGTYENELAEAREKAIEEMCSRAARMGANAVIGVDVDYEVLGKENGMLMVSVSGTAVVLR